MCLPIHRSTSALCLKKGLVSCIVLSVINVYCNVLIAQILMKLILHLDSRKFRVGLVMVKNLKKGLASCSVLYVMNVLR